MARLSAVRQARALARLRVRLALRSYRRSGSGARTVIAVVAMFVVPGALAVGVSAWGFFVDAPPEAVALRAQAMACGAWILWALSPLFGAPTNEALDLERLAVFPLRRGAIVAGMIAGALTDVTALLTLPALVGVGLALARGAAGILVGVALALVLGHMVVAAQVVTTAMSGLWSNRRMRDVVVGTMFVVFMVVWALSMLLHRIDLSDVDAVGVAMARGRQLAHTLLPHTPPGSAAAALSRAAAGDVGGAITAGARSLAWLALGVWVWLALLERVERGAGTPWAARSTSSARTGAAVPSRHGASARTGAAVPAVAVGGVRARRGVRSGRSALTGSVLGRLLRTELRLTWRTPARRMNVVQALVMSGVITFSALGDVAGRSVAAVLTAAPVLALLVTMMIGANRFGYEGASLSAVVVSPLPRRRYLQLHVLSCVVVSMGVATVVAAVYAIRGAALPALAAWALAGAVSFVAADAALAASVFVPFAVGRGRRGGLATMITAPLAMIVAPIGVALVTAPAWAAVLVAAWHPSARAWLAAGAVALAWGAAVHRAALGPLARAFAEREADILAVVAVPDEA